MMSIFSSLHAYGDWGLLALRIAVGVIFLVHGFAKRVMWKMSPSVQMPASLLNILRILSIAEPLGGVAVLTGFLTQLASVGLGIIMLGAMNTKIRKMKAPFMGTSTLGWEFDFIILAAAIALVIFGGGSFALDRMI